MGGGATAGPAAEDKSGQDFYLMIGALMKPRLFRATFISSFVLGLAGSGWQEWGENMVAFGQSHTAFCASEFPQVRL